MDHSCLDTEIFNSLIATRLTILTSNLKGIKALFPIDLIPVHLVPATPAQAVALKPAHNALEWASDHKDCELTCDIIDIIKK